MIGKYVHTILRVGLLLTAFSFGACSSEEAIKIPNDVMGQEEFIDVYADALLIEAAYKQRLYKKEDPEVWLGKRYGELFEKKNVDSEKYHRSLTWYTGQTEMFRDMYDDIIERLNKLEAQQNLDEKQDENP